MASHWSQQTPFSENTREDSTHGHHQMVNTKIRLIVLFAAKDGEALLQSAKVRLGADCVSDYELLIAKFRLKLKKVRKTTRPFRYNLNSIIKIQLAKLVETLQIPFSKALLLVFLNRRPTSFRALIPFEKITGCAVHWPLASFDPPTKKSRGTPILQRPNCFF